MMNKIFPIIAFAGLSIFLSSKHTDSISEPLLERKIENINSAWQYLENGLTDIKALEDQKDWQTIDLPHTWNQWDAVDNTPGYRRDASWYQKEIFLENFSEAQYLLYFEGVNITSDVYVNGQRAGGHIGGYVGFEIDITPFIKKGQKNKIAVRVDNSYNPNIIPSQKADFFIYGGITRDVWLKILPKINLKNIQITTPAVSSQSASTTLKIDLHHAELLDDNFTIKSKILEPSTQKVVAEKTIKANGAKNSSTLTFAKINNPKLWSPDHPHLYQVITQLYDGDQLIDEKVERMAYRWFHFEDYGAFYLNGERLLLRGTHRHEEHAGYGAAMPNELHRKDIQQIKEIGANFLRLGHYPQDPEVYKACDELGLIVWDELPWCRGGVGEATWQAHTERLLKEQIRQNFNHPSILFWSLGNEIYWLPDFENGDDTSRMNAFLKKLDILAHQLDPHRMTSIRKYYAGADLVDVFSPSIWSGWYGGVYTNYQKTLTENQKKYPRFLHMEYGGSSHVGRHTENPITGPDAMNKDNWTEVANQVNIKNIAKGGDWSENYIVDLFDWYLGITETKNDLSGNAQWAFKDFGTPLRPENAIPYLNQKGLVDRSGKPKDAYYVFKSYWSKEPFTYIESHTWTERRGPKGKTKNLAVFSNCESVELFQNNQSLGKKNRKLGVFPACGLNWDILFTKGKNQLIAKGFKNGKVITADTMTVNYDYTQAGKPDKIALSHRKLPNGNHLVEAFMQDKDGLRVLDYEKHLYFSKDGAGAFLMNYGTPTRSQVIQMANGYAAIELHPSKTGKAIIEARNQDFKGSYLVIDFDKENRVSKAAKT
ncbi:MAG: glycoside hydrolase family 2 TIM barrel-domain containing protein, partial [Bacteroidota bacterium]